VDVRDFNERAWDRQVGAGNRWTMPVSADEIARARAGEWAVVLTPTRAVPREWFGELAGCDVLGLAAGGGQQSCILAAAGANVTVLDNSTAQLAQDRMVAERDGLALRSEHGDMRDLSRFADASFDLILHPCSNGFVPDVRPVWRECFRVLRPGGRLLSGMVQPALYLFDDEEVGRGSFVARYPLPYSDLEARDAARIARMEAEGEPLSFGHTLDDQIGGQLDAGFLLAGFYEDRWPDHPLDRFFAPLFATLALKPAGGSAALPPIAR
jgi:SAM-dependent methyltransferase